MAELDPAELRRRLDGARVVDVASLSGGASSLTFAGTRDGQRVVVKVAPPGVAPVAHRDVLRQARIIKALGTSGVPVPTVLWEDAGGPPESPPLYVMTHVDGECVEPLFDDCAPVPGLGDRYRNACRAMAALHRLPPRGLGLGDEPVVDPVAEVHRWSDTLRTVDPALAPDWPEVRDALLDCAPRAMTPRRAPPVIIFRRSLHSAAPSPQEIFGFRKTFVRNGATPRARVRQTPTRRFPRD